MPQHIFAAFYNKNAAEILEFNIFENLQQSFSFLIEQGKHLLNILLRNRKLRHSLGGEVILLLLPCIYCSVCRPD